MMQPGFFDSSLKHEVVCGHCDHVISKSWSDIYTWLILIELAIPLVFWLLDMSFLKVMQLFLGLTVLLMVLVYFILPLKDFGPRPKRKS